jgi:hypothetical protein
MPVLIPVKASIKVVRKGKRLAVPVGKAFQFTDDEVSTIHKIMPGALRSPVVEKFVADEEEEEDEDEDADLDVENEDEDEAEDASGEDKKPAAKSSAKSAPAKKSAAKKAAAADDDI